jgi:hypothetical protein
MKSKIQDVHCTRHIFYRCSICDRDPASNSSSQRCAVSQRYQSAFCMQSEENHGAIESQTFEPIVTHKTWQNTKQFCATQKTKKHSKKRQDCMCSKQKKLDPTALFQGASLLHRSACTDITVQLLLLPKRSCVTTSSSLTSKSISLWIRAAGGGGAGGAEACASALQVLGDAGLTHRPTVTWHDEGMVKHAEEALEMR